mgnify:CR=1 FL=1
MASTENSNMLSLMRFERSAGRVRSIVEVLKTTLLTE